LLFAGITYQGARRVEVFSTIIIVVSMSCMDYAG
jgi:hypothetical protein